MVILGKFLSPTRDDGTPLGATFQLHPVGVFDVVYHHKSGRRGGERSVNPDYHEGLELLIRRLASVSASILSISLDSKVARKLPEDQRELPLDFPIPLSPSADPAGPRVLITRAQKGVAGRGDAKVGGGNDQKTIRIMISVEPSIGLAELESLLVIGNLP